MSTSTNYIRLIAETGGSSVNLGIYINQWQQKTLEIINIVCDTTLGTLAIQLPRIVDMRGMSNCEFVILDESGTADTNNITITRGGTDIIGNSATSLVIDSERGSVLFRQTKNDQSADAGAWLVLQQVPSFSPLFTNNATSTVIRTSLSAIAQAANKFYGGPATGVDAVPTFRSIGSADLPILWGQADLDFGNTLAQTSTDLFIAVAGAEVGDPVILGTAGLAVSDNTCYTAFVSTADQVRIRFNNYSSAPVNPASGVFTVGVIKMPA